MSFHVAQPHGHIFKLSPHAHCLGGNALDYPTHGALAHPRVIAHPGERGHDHTGCVHAVGRASPGAFAHTWPCIQSCCVCHADARSCECNAAMHMQCCAYMQPLGLCKGPSVDPADSDVRSMQPTLCYLRHTIYAVLYIYACYYATSAVRQAPVDNACSSALHLSQLELRNGSCCGGCW